MSSINDNYLVDGNASILNLKNTHNQLVNSLQDSSLANLLLNPSMKFIPLVTSIPVHWDFTGAGISFSDSANFKVIHFSNVSGCDVHQNIWGSSLLLNSEYTAIFDLEISAGAVVFASIIAYVGGNPVPLVQLNPASDTITLTQSTTNLGKFRVYFHFKTSNQLPDYITFKIANSSVASTVLIRNLAFVKGAIELFDFDTQTDFETSVSYDTTTHCWKLSHDGGATYSKILTLNDGGNAYVEPIYPTVDMIVKDPIYNVSYKLVAEQNLVSTTPTTRQFVVTYPTFSNWNSTTAYYVGNKVAANNLVWECVVINTGNNPIGHTELWKLGAPKTLVEFGYDFLSYQKAYYNEHCQSTTTIDNGIHRFHKVGSTHITKIDNTGSTPIMTTTGTVGATNNTDANNLPESFSVEHNINGEHVFNSKALRVSISDVSSAITLASSPITYTIFTDSVIQTFKDVFVYQPYYGTYQAAKPYTFHDTNGRHVVEAQCGSSFYPFYLNNADNIGPMEPLVIKDTTLINNFNVFKLEHDMFGRHVFCDATTAIFYTITLYKKDTTFTLCLIPLLYVPPTNIDNFLSLYNVEHDIRGNHVFKCSDGNSYILDPSNATSNTDLQFSLVLPIYGQEVHPNRINMSTGNHHSNPVNGHYHRFYVDNGVLKYGG